MYQIYQIQFNDTLDSIAKKFNTTTENIKQLNNIINNLPMPGISIVVPNADTMDVRYDTYVIQKGDTLYSIAQRYNIPVNTIALINGLKQNDYIYPGQKLMVPKNNNGIYVTVIDDTLDNVSKKIGTSVQNLMDNNQDIFLMPDQIIFYSKN